MAIHTCIIGGGAIGSALSYWLATMGDGREVVVVDPDFTGELACTTRSAAAFRVQFNLSANTALSLASADFFRRASDLLSVEGVTTDIGFESVPYLVLAGWDGIERLRSAHRRQVEAGANVAFLGDTESLVTAAPWLRADGVGAATLGLSGEGWVDPKALLLALQCKSRSLGVQHVSDRVTGLVRQNDRVAKVALATGKRIEAREVVICAGAHSAEIAALAGVTLPIEPRKRTAFVFCAPRPVSGFCNLVDPTFANRGVYARPFGENFLAVTSPSPEQDVATHDLTPDIALFESIVKPALARRVDGLQEMTLLRAWAGSYEINTFDQNAVIGRHPDLKNLYFSCGYSGHGVMHAPAAGQALAELLLMGRYSSLDLSPFCFERIANGSRFDDVQASEHRENSAGV